MNTEAVHTVIEELDTFKKGLSETGRNARHFSRILDELRDRGSLNVGIPIFKEKANSGKVFVILESIKEFICPN